jgi:hypothetical protein
MKQFIPALAAVGGVCGLAAVPAGALELGELTVESALGQPLRASIAYALQPDEQLHSYCVSLKSGVTGSGLPALSRARITVSDRIIRLSGEVPILEPMLGLQLVVDCPYTANLQREYAMFFNFKPAAVTRFADSALEVGQTEDLTTSKTAVAGSDTQPVRATIQKPAAAVVPAGSRYQVRPGDSLSGIVARIEDRPAGLWPAVEIIFAANPHAFIDGDINLIKAGSWLEIPDLYAVLGTQTSPRLAAPTSNSTRAMAAIDAQAPSLPDISATEYVPFDSGFVEPEQSASAPVENSTTRSLPGSGELRPGDVILQGDDPFVTPVDADSSKSGNVASSVVIPDTDDSRSLANPTAQPSVQPSASRGATNGSWAGLAWLGGAGIAVFLGLLLFGRTVRQRFGSTPVGAEFAGERGRRRADSARSLRSAGEVDFAIDDNEASSPSISLDADLGLGTGLRNSADIDVNQDFGFSASEDFSGEFDFEIPESAAVEPDQHPTDIIPPNRNNRDDVCILESEIPPSDDDDDEYDLSMIVDVTRQPVVDTHLTAKDLKAVPVDAADDDDDSEEYTLSREVDYKILEQDYQEEFTTTQALNEEIARAAMELAETMGRYPGSDDTAEMPAGFDDEGTAEVTSQLPSRRETEITAEMTASLVGHGDAVNDELISDLDDTGVNEELTAKLPHADNDVTIEMDVEGGRIDTKRKSKAS